MKTKLLLKSNFIRQGLEGNLPMIKITPKSSICKTTGKILLPAKEVPIYKQVDVVVVGGGPAGFSAAVSSARCNVKTLLVERYGYLGGMWTTALVNPYFDVLGKGGINEELRSRLKKLNCWGGLWDISFDPNQMKLILDDLIEESNVELLLYALGTTPLIENNRINGVVVETKSGPLAIIAKQVIDCTGDGDIAARSEVPFQAGKPKDGLMQPMTMMFRIGGIRRSAYLDYLSDVPSKWYEDLKTLVPEDELLKAIPFGSPAFISLPRKNEAIIQWTHLVRFSGIDAGDLTKATIEGRKQVRYAMKFLQKLESRLGKIYLVELPVSIGIRETRRIEGEYTLTLEDLMKGSRFSDGICLVKFPIDIHEPEGKKQTVIGVKPYHIPYRCLIPKKVENLLVAGRCISGSCEAHASYRVTGNCVSMGEAAGVAAAMSVKQRKSPREISGESIADYLRKSGIKLE